MAGTLSPWGFGMFSRQWRTCWKRPFSVASRSRATIPGVPSKNRILPAQDDKYDNAYPFIAANEKRKHVNNNGTFFKWYSRTTLTPDFDQIQSQKGISLVIGKEKHGRKLRQQTNLCFFCIMLSLSKNKGMCIRIKLRNIKYLNSAPKKILWA
jgi:hypothetical protein